MDTFEGLSFEADEDTVASQAAFGGCCQWVLDAAFHTVEWSRQPLRFESVFLRSPSTNSYVDLVTAFAILKKIGGVPTGICQAPDDYRGFRFSRGLSTPTLIMREETFA